MEKQHRVESKNLVSFKRLQCLWSFYALHARKQSLELAHKKSPDAVHQGFFLVAEAGLEPTTFGL